VTGQLHFPREDWPLVIPFGAVVRANEYLCPSSGGTGEDLKILNPPWNLRAFQSRVYRWLFSRDQRLLDSLTHLLPGGVALTLGHLSDCFASRQGRLKCSERRFFVQARDRPSVKRQEELTRAIQQRVKAAAKRAKEKTSAKGQAVRRR